MDASNRDAGMFVHTWEAPALVCDSAVGRFSAAGRTACAFAQQGGISFLAASDNTVDVSSQLDIHDRLDGLATVSLPGALSICMQSLGPCLLQVPGSLFTQDLCTPCCTTSALFSRSLPCVAVSLVIISLR